MTKIPTDNLVYQHAFALTDKYLIMFESPFYFDMKWSLIGYDMSNVFAQDPSKTTKIHLVKLEDGQKTTIDSGIWTVVLHFGNAFEKDGKIVVDAPSLNDAGKDPFKSMLFENL